MHSFHGGVSSLSEASGSQFLGLHLYYFNITVPNLAITWCGALRRFVRRPAVKTRVRASDTLTWTLPLRLLSHITYHSILFIVVYYKGQSGVDGLHFYIVPEHNRIQLRLLFLHQVYIPSSSTKQTKYLMLFILSAQRHVISVSTWWTRLTHRMCLPRLRVELTGKEIAGFLWHVLLFLCATRHCNKTTTGSTCTVDFVPPQSPYTFSDSILLILYSFIKDDGVIFPMELLFHAWTCFNGFELPHQRAKVTFSIWNRRFWPGSEGVP